MEMGSSTRLRHSKRPTRPTILGIWAAFALLLAFVLLESGNALSSARPQRAPVSPASGEFVSLVPACACGRQTALAAFSLRDGRRLQTITTVETIIGRFLTLSGSQSGGVLATASKPADCTSDVAGCGPVPDTCRTEVSRLSDGRLVPLFAAAESVFIDQAVASPDGRSVATVAEPCTQGSTQLVVRDLANGTQRSIGTGLPRCTDLGNPAWNSTGSELVIPYGAVPNPHQKFPAGICPVPHYAELAIASALHPSRTSGWPLVAADPGCSFLAATFDPSGIAAVEGCRLKGQSDSYIDPGLGQARLLQLNRTDQVIARLDLKPGWEEGEITTEPSGRVLISQDQPANEPYPERDSVWEFDGHDLRLIHTYKAEDAAEITAIPYHESPTTGSSSMRPLPLLRPDRRSLTVVAATRGEDLPHAYLKLHAAGLSVTFAHSFSLNGAD